MNIVTVSINDVDYNLKGEENDEYLKKVADYVDKKMKTIMESNPKLSGTAAAVLTAVNVVDDLFKCEVSYKGLNEEIRNLKAKEKDYEEQIAALKELVARVQGENSELLQKLNDSKVDENLKAKDEELARLKEEVEKLKEELKNTKNSFEKNKAENKELKFQLRSARYKINYLEQELVENQINLAKIKKMSNPLINHEKIK
ncbi:MAG: cell division protein ZapA [Clostridiales bacterium]|uniref:cell division protein ZapA n=1 Tax=Clostridium sp. N3C TaxID=1776758 RepID=UPI00092E0CDE|nr:cell division protein ZapA [Clostridium sp. N3C]NLZ48968.1 cell division protein ZapA [Clostridiales bacterium]SCN21454.1 Z ring-associated protein ZapA [Clostridium sp. N3C]